MRSFVIVAIICYVLYVLIPQTTIIRSLLLALISIIVVLVVSYTLMAKSVRKEIMSFVVRKVRKQI